MAKHMVQYLHFRILTFPLISWLVDIPFIRKKMND